MADSIEAERRGIAAATVAVEQLASTVGVSMAAAHGLPGYPIAMMRGDWDLSRMADEGFKEGLRGASGVERLAREVADIWLTGTLPSVAVSEGE